MAAGGIDPDEDVRLVYLPPLRSKVLPAAMDGSASARRNSVAVDSDVGRILHFGYDIMAHVSEKVLAVREALGERERRNLSALVCRSLRAPANFSDDRKQPPCHAEIVARRIVCTRTCCPHARWQSQDRTGGRDPQSDRYIVIGREGAEPAPIRSGCVAYAQIVRWAQAPLSEFARGGGKVFRADLLTLRGAFEPCRVACVTD
jgi:NitT/TauT family transport system ATP-binding protein